NYFDLDKPFSHENELDARLARAPADPRYPIQLRILRGVRFEGYRSREKGSCRTAHWRSRRIAHWRSSRIAHWRSCRIAHWRWKKAGGRQRSRRRLNRVEGAHFFPKPRTYETSALT